MSCRHSSAKMILWLFLALSLLLPTGLFAKEDKVPADVDEATKWVTEGIKHTGCTVDRLDEQYVLYSCGPKSGIALARITSIQGDCWQDYTRDQAECLPTPYSMTSFGARSDAKHAGRFADGLKYLAAAARQQALAHRETGFAQFSIQAKAWREVSPKPAMPDAAHEHQVLAEYAFKERETEKSMREYQSALDIFPTWPEGQFNLATLAGEQKDYDVAIFHMKEYLELVPDSPDASAAKDSIIIWKDKLNSIFGPEANTVASGANSRAKSKY